MLRDFTRGAFFDFTGKPENVLQYLPADTIFLDPSRFPFSFNILRHMPPTDAAHAVLETVKSAYGYEGATPVLDMYLTASVASLAHAPDSTLLGLPYLFTDAAYRRTILGQVKDPVLLHFWHDFFDRLSDKDKHQQTLSTLNKVYALLFDTSVRAVIGQKRTSWPIDLEKRYVFSFPPSLGREKQSFLATLILTALPDFPVYLDGGHMLGPRAVMGKTHVTFCHEYLAQLSEPFREALLGTADTVTVFAMGPTEIDRFEREFPADNFRYKLNELRPFWYHERRDGVPTYDLTTEQLDAVTDPAKTENISRTAYGTPDAEEAMTRFLSTVSTGTLDRPARRRKTARGGGAWTSSKSGRQP